VDKLIEDRLNAQIFEFKTGPWKEAIDGINSFIASTDIKLFDYYSPYRVSIELLKNNEPYFKLTFFFRVFPSSPKRPDWCVMPSITLHQANMEKSGLEKQFTGLDKEITLIKTSEITDLMKSLIRNNGGQF